MGDEPVEAGALDTPPREGPGAGSSHEDPERHLVDLAPALLDLLRVASTLGNEFRAEHLARLVQRQLARVWLDLGPAREAGLLRAHAEGLVFASAGVRDLLHGQLPEDVRRAINADARALREQDRAEPGVSARAADDPVGGETVADRATSLLIVGRSAACEAACRVALASDVGDRDADRLRTLLIQSLLVQGRLGEVRRESRRAGTAEGMTPATVAHRRATAAVAAAHLDPPSVALVLVEGAEDLSTSSRNLDASSIAARARIVVLAASGDIEGAEEHGRAWELQAELADPGLGGVGMQLSIARTLGLAGRLHEALGHLARMKVVLDARGPTGAIVLWHGLRSVLLGEIGRWQEASDELTLALAAPADHPSAWLTDAIASEAMRAALAGDRGRADDLLVTAEDLLSAWTPAEPSALLHLASATRSLIEGRPTDALALLAELWARRVADGRAIDGAVIGPVLAALAASHDRSDLAGEVAQALTGLAQRNPSVAWLAGAADQALGWAGEGAPAFERSGDAMRRASRPLDVARAMEGCALAGARAGDGPGAKRWAVSALDVLETLGAVGEASRTRAAYRAAGIRIGTRGPRDRGERGAQGLTVAERKVAVCVAEGLTNPEIASLLFVSRSTVAGHVSSILRKLGMTSRADVITDVASGRLDLTAV